VGAAAGGAAAVVGLAGGAAVGCAGVEVGPHATSVATITAAISESTILRRAGCSM
jgi:hypothetical protein